MKYLVYQAEHKPGARRSISGRELRIVTAEVVDDFELAATIEGCTGRDHPVATFIKLDLAHPEHLALICAYGYSEVLHFAAKGKPK